ncbi:hypothetical protein [Streptomyces tsukubensis]|uniref:LPXTG cell wall anchor domain-containing protein n=1 Tax=Streptomyces tsukubensis (strain DSM 42081 / NBRC 108919 / NRRL 18488 / 9993) TaxID=1114943 RepID=A0A7G3U8Y8_STRT9|nr:hypothetical protein [Streptomyces tsukubensis]AZK98085.1 hypothetical protein B7R87_32495 [Streptomyces tsukubensis]QKM65991.1 hypothetical protein STSU_001265 [Streptomyces tsukubensis NRRL18488]TAI42274.1 hypothetical protein EWI31_22005 [Streptomyces tsukubensis]
MTLARFARAAAALGLTAAALGASVSPAAADPQPMGRCTTSSGAVLAVDFSRWGGPVYRSCGTTPTTGYELLNQGGWRTAGTGHDGPAFICRIGYSGHRGGKMFPPPDQEDCVLTPPASAYWSYWHADPGENTWEYSTLGAMLYKPKPGSVDLWIFGGTDIGGTKGRPKVTPDQLRAHNTRPVGGAPAPSGKAPSVPPGTDTGPAPVRTTAPAAPSPATTPSTAPSAPSGSAPTSAAPSPSPSTAAPSPAASVPGAVAAASGAPKVVDAAPATDVHHDSGSALPVIATVGLVVVLGGAAVVTVRRRRRTD